MQPQAAFQEAKKPNHPASERPPPDPIRPDEATNLPRIRSNRRRAARVAPGHAKPWRPRRAETQTLHTMVHGRSQEPAWNAETSPTKAADQALPGVSDRHPHPTPCSRTSPPRKGRSDNLPRNPAYRCASNPRETPSHDNNHASPPIVPTLSARRANPFSRDNRRECTKRTRQPKLRATTGPSIDAFSSAQTVECLGGRLFQALKDRFLARSPNGMASISSCIG